MKKTVDKPGAVKSVETLTPRALKTRAKLLAAALKLLNKTGLQGVRVADVAAEAGVASGLFYRYFSDINDVVYELIDNFFAALNSDTAALPNTARVYEQILAIMSVAVKKFAENPGVTSSAFELPIYYPEFNDLWQKRAYDWILIVLGLLKDKTKLSRKQLLTVAIHSGAMMEGVIYQYFVRQTAVLRKEAPKLSDLAKIIADLWYRSILALERPAENAGAAREESRTR